MFTGIVEELGTVVELDVSGGDARLRVEGPTVVSGTAPGDSIAVDGVCLTVVDVGEAVFGVDVMPESLARTALGRSGGGRTGQPRACRARRRPARRPPRPGHVDGVGTLLSRTPGERWDDLAFGCPPALTRYVAEKGSIAVSGVSLTVTWVAPQSFGVSLIPTTLARTTLGGLGVGDEVNLEVDVIAKYVERLLGAAAAASAGDAA